MAKSICLFLIKSFLPMTLTKKKVRNVHFLLSTEPHENASKIDFRLEPIALILKTSL